MTVTSFYLGAVYRMYASQSSTEAADTASPWMIEDGKANAFQLDYISNVEIHT